MPLTVVVVDDDEWKRIGIAHRLGATEEIDVVASMDQIEAAELPLSYWTDIDCILVDVFDDQAVGQTGTDLYSGIRVIERVRDLPLRSIAITPSCAHPLVHLRLEHASPDFSYHRYQLNTLEALSEAARFPDREHKLPPVNAHVRRRLGAARLVPNKVVQYYEQSELHGLLVADTTQSQLFSAGLRRRAPGDLKAAVVSAGYEWHETSRFKEDPKPSAKPRWPVIRDLVLTLLGRLDAPWSEYDRPWWGA